MMSALRFMPRVFAATVLAAALIGAVPCAQAGASELGVNPVQVFLSRDASSALLTLTNQSLTQLVRLQITGFAWQQKANGDMDLQPSDDLVFFPTTITLQPGAERKLRVGITAPPAATERTYRIFVEELPGDAATSERGARLNVRSKIGIPVFVAPAKRSVKAAIADAAWPKAGTLSVKVENEGTVHFLAQKLEVTGKDATGATVFDRPVNAWYVLAGGTREFTIDVPKEACRRTKSLAVKLTTDEGVFAHNFQTSGGGCAQ